MLTIPQIINKTAQRYIAVRLPVSIPFGDDLDPAFDELFSAFARAGVEPDGMEFIKFNLIDMPRLETDGCDCNACRLGQREGHEVGQPPDS